jgi:hypothetical protein
MPNNNIGTGRYSLGPNNSVSILDANGEVPWGLQNIINFKSNPIENTKDIMLMRGITDHLKFRNGYRGELEIQRADGGLDAYWGVTDAQVRAGLPEPLFTVIQTVLEVNGGISRYTFQNCIFYYEDSGTWANEEGVIQRINFLCPVRIVEV